MATKMTSKKKQGGVVLQWPKPVAAVRDNVEKVARRTWREAVDLLPAGTRKAVKQATVDLERASADLQRRVDRLRADIEARGERIVAQVTSQAEKALSPLVHKLDVASRSDVERLRRRVTALERQGAKRPDHSSAVA